MAEMFVNYEKSKQDFISAGLPNVYNNHIVFINPDKCIYTHGKYFADFGDVNFVKGIYINGDYYNSLKGGGYISLISANPNKLNINASSSGVEIGLNEEFINTIGTVSAVDSDTTIDDIEDTCVKYSPQFLSEEQKAQVRHNIGITSEGDIVVEEAPYDGITAGFVGDNVMKHGVIYISNLYNADSIIIIENLETPDKDVVEYTWHFKTNTFPTLSLPSYLYWANGEIPEIEDNTMYELSITATKYPSTDEYVYKAILIPFKTI